MFECEVCRPPSRQNSFALLLHMLKSNYIFGTNLFGFPTLSTLAQELFCPCFSATPLSYTCI